MKKAKVESVNEEEVAPIKRWASKKHPKSTIKVVHLWDDYYRVNIFDTLDVKGCTVPHTTLTEGYFVALTDGEVIDKTTGRVKKNVFAW